LGGAGHSLGPLQLGRVGGQGRGRKVIGYLFGNIISFSHIDSA
jgi:hypothetical protein